MMDNEGTPLPRGEGAEIPQNPAAPVGLAYTEQNFNALVHANGVLTTRNQDLEEAIEERRKAFDTTMGHQRQLENMIASLRADKEQLLARVADLDHQVENERAGHEHAKLLLERAKGYLDAKLDADSEGGEWDLRRTARGPRLGEVPHTVRGGRPHAGNWQATDAAFVGELRSTDRNY